MGKKGDLSNFERGMVVGDRWASLSISQSAQLLGFSRTTISRFFFCFVFSLFMQQTKTTNICL